MSAAAGNAPSTMSDSFQTLPVELVMRIINFLALDLRDTAPARARPLLLISRSVRRSLLPLLYEVVVAATYDTRDCRSHYDKHPQGLQFISRLLRTPSASHIKSMIFCRPHANQYPIMLNGERKAEAQPWLLDDLIVSEHTDAMVFFGAGICARAVHQLHIISATVPSIGRAALTSTRLLWSLKPKTRSHVRFFTQPAKDHDQIDLAQKDHQQAASKIWMCAFTHHELDPLRKFDFREWPEDGRGVFVFIDVGSSDGFGDLSVALLDEIAVIFDAKRTHAVYNAILVYPQNEQDIVVSDAAEGLRTHFPVQVHDRLWVARSSANRKLMARDPPLGLARTLQQDIDPWEKGRRVSEFVHEDKREE